MARNGSGTYSNPYPNFVSGTVISSSETDANNSAIATALTQSIAVDGQSTVTANLPLNAKKLTGLAVGTAATDSISLGQAQAEAFVWCGTAGGSANAITLAPSPAITAYAAGQRFVWMASSTVNTGATTVAISGLGAIALQDNGAALVAGNHAASKMFMGILNTTSTVQIMQVQSSGTDPLIVSSLTVSGTATIGGILSVDDTTTSTSGTTGSIHTDGGLGVAGTAFVAGAAKIVGVTTHGGDVLSDTDSTDSIGSSAVRWAGTWTDAINGVTSPTAQYTSAEETKLAGIEASADVTDATNVLAGLAGQVAVAATFEPTGDTSASDNAAIGYTAAEGLILTGQGSTSDITLKNDADAIVFTVPTGTDDILFPDNAKAMFGASSDLQIYHNGSYSLISDSGTGNLILACQDFSLSNPAVGEYMITAAVNGAVTLYYDNNAKLATSSTGVAITGEATATGFTGTLDGVLGGGTPAAATVTTIDASGVATATTFEPDGDTSAGDNAAMGYTSVLGAILTGQGSTNDVTLVNDADATVLSIPTGTTNVAITGDITANNFAGRNLIINGDMAIAQRGTSIVTPTNTVYLLDRYKYFISGTTAAVTVTQDSDMPAGHIGFSMKVDCTTADASVAAGDVAGFHYYVEGFDSAHLAAGTAAAKTITISFWVKSPKTGGHGVIVKNGANNRAYPASYTVSVADTWEYKTMTVAMDTAGGWIGATNGIGLGLYFPLIAGSNFTDPADAWVAAECYGINSGVNILDNAANNFYLTELQVEAGTAATEFERIPHSTQLAKCQRYYEKTYKQATAPGTATEQGALIAIASTTAIIAVNWQFAVIKRAAPTVALYSYLGTSGDWSVVTTNADTASVSAPWGAQDRALTRLDSSSLTAGAAYFGHATADAEL
jgi:hypothetical protein